jgi:Domain of unknown function (DUF4156)
VRWNDSASYETLSTQVLKPLAVESALPRRETLKPSLIAAAASLLALSGCIVTSLSVTGQRVRITSNPETVRGCKFVGNVSGSDVWNGRDENVLNEIRNKAGELGADVVFLTQSSNQVFVGAHAIGEAYRCGPR